MPAPRIAVKPDRGLLSSGSCQPSQSHGYTPMQRTIARLLTTTAVLLLAAAPSAAQDATITIGGEVPNPITVTAKELAALPRHHVTATDHGGAARYEGVDLTDVLKLAGVVLGNTVRGPRLAQVVLIEARDGYRAVFALAELDTGFREKQVLLVDRRDGKPLDSEAGPWRLVVPEEKRAARWVRQISKISVVTVKPPG